LVAVDAAGYCLWAGVVVCLHRSVSQTFLALFGAFSEKEGSMRVNTITSVKQCLSDEERRQRAGVTLVNLLLWFLMLIFTLVTWGILLVVVGAAWMVRNLLSGYHVRKIQALGATVSDMQFPQVAEAVNDVCRRFGIAQVPRVVVISSGETNAFAVKFARKRVVLILSELLEGILDQPTELRAVLGHEICHGIMDHGMRGAFEIYRPARYKAARELTCDNVGLVAAYGDLDSAKTVVKKLCVGNKLSQRLSEEALMESIRACSAGSSGGT
jgi:Zn-dependent protease with chaperone function